MKIKLKDLQLALDTIAATHAEWIDVQDGARPGTFELSYPDSMKNLATITLYESHLGITPDLRITAKLYKKEGSK